ncbi:hypothetical protein PYW08_011727 [Mythimna loreyi]|uniref:Uncharacterized protein n=1 Tax=Mythimna loreyi TaxID=667449 RepID=A0ACC2QKN0_9NEOP|nr:hypothetical protein PYW08_011727 [Mythimna loreyi]
MSKFPYLLLSVMAVRLISVYASETGPASMEDVFKIILECAKENGVSQAEIQRLNGSSDVKNFNPCLWSCTLRRVGFLDDKGQYVLNPGLTYVKNIVKNDAEYTKLETIAKECESVKDKKVSDGIAGCEMGALVATCLLEQYESERH